VLAHGVDGVRRLLVRFLDVVGEVADMARELADLVLVDLRPVDADELQERGDLAWKLDGRALVTVAAGSDG
jgi:hypothetical protein